MDLQTINERFIATCEANGISAIQAPDMITIKSGDNQIDLVVEFKNGDNSNASINFYKTEETKDTFVSEVLNIYTVVAQQGD